MSSKSLDKFYTNDKAARTFIDYVQKFVRLEDFDNIIEPSAGAGALVKYLPPRTIGVDLVPEDDGVYGIIQSDFFNFKYPQGRNITIGNPPFGSRSKLAVEFFKHAAKSSDVIAFIIPVTWEKYSIHKKLPRDWSLIATERLPEASFELDGKPHNVRCCIQVWARGGIGLRKTIVEPNTHPDFLIKQGYNANATFTIRGVRPKVGDDIEVFSRIDPATRYYSVEPLTDGVREVFDRVDWTKHWQGVSMPTVSISDCIEIYNMYK